MSESQTPAPPASPAPAPVPQRRKWLKFAIGFLGWYLANGLIWLLFPIHWQGISVYTSEDLTPVLCILPLNILVPIVLAIPRPTRWVALGLLAALVLNFAISLLFGLFWQAVCLVPFFSK